MSMEQLYEGFVSSCLKSGETPDSFDDFVNRVKADKENAFRKELQELINRHSLENESDTPDWILAEYLASCLVAFDIAVLRRETWWGREKETTHAIHVESDQQDED